MYTLSITNNGKVCKCMDMSTYKSLRIFLHTSQLGLRSIYLVRIHSTEYVVHKKINIQIDHILYQ